MGSTAGEGARNALVVCSVLEPTMHRVMARLGEVPRECGLVEIRCDHLTADEVSAIVRGAGRPILVAARRPVDGGVFAGSEQERGRVLRAALAAGAALIDVEQDSGLRELAGRAGSDRVVLSRHGVPCDGTLRSHYHELSGSHSGRLKLVARAGSPDSALWVREVLEASARDGARLACFSDGRAGTLTRILAPSWGSWATYGCAHRGAEAAPGQIPVRDLLEVYRVLEITKGTRRFALLGRNVSGSPSPAMHGAAYRRIGLDAVYLPIEAEALAAGVPLLGAEGIAGIEALAVTMPFKQEAARLCADLDETARASGAVNTVRISTAGWSGHNTDGPAIVDCIRQRLDPRGCEVAIVGAGGTALAAAAALTRVGANVRLYNRTEERAVRAGARVGVEARALADLGRDPWDVLVQATPLGARGERIAEVGRLTGRLVVDVVVRAMTPLLRDASRAGLMTVGGLEILAAQGALQFEVMTGVRPDAIEMRQAAEQWLASRQEGSAPLDARSGAE